MISVNQALSLIQLEAVAPRPVEVALEEASEKVLADNISSPIDMPPFSQSAMDGYAIRGNSSGEFRIIGESKAGDAPQFHLDEGEAVRIFTGAMVPENADTVVIQEHVEVKYNKLSIIKFPSTGANIRLKGEQFQKGSPVLNKGTVLNESGIALLAGLGINKVKVFDTPKIAIIVTGDELQKPGTVLKPGKIFESNSFMLKAALKRNKFRDVHHYKVRDNILETKETIRSALAENDVLLLSGGISVGEYDFVREALFANGVEEIFYKVNQKPGKPLWFGKKEDKRVFGLPGNPAASLVCFYVYVLPALRRQKGFKNVDLKKASAILSRPAENKSGKSLFLKAKVQDGRIDILDGQSSSMMHSFTQSNALVMIPGEKELIGKNEKVEYLDLGYEY